MSERQRKGFPWIPLSPSTLMGLRKPLLPAHCGGLRTGDIWVLLISAPPDKGQAVWGTGLSPPFPPPRHCSVPLSTFAGSQVRAQQSGA